MSVFRKKQDDRPAARRGLVRGRRGLVFSSLALLPTAVAAAFVMSAAIRAPHVASAAAGAPAQLAWLGWLALIPLLRAAQVLSPRRAVAFGACWGVGVVVFGALHRGAVSASPLSLTLLACIPACYVWVGSLITRRVGFSPFVLAVLWMLAELALRPLAMHHGLLAATQGDGFLTRTIGGLFGYVIVAFIVAYGSGLILDLVCRLRLPIPPIDIRAHLEPTAERLWHVIRCIRSTRQPRTSTPRAPPATA